MATADIQRVGAQTVWAIGARSDNYAFEVEDDRFDIDEIANAIIQTEAELVRLFADAGHPQREPFLTWLPTNGQASGVAVPAHIGQIEAIRVLRPDFPEVQTFVRSSGNILTGASHGFDTGQKVRVSTTNTLPAGLSINTDYYVIVLTTSTYSLATSLANALLGTAIVLSSAGTGTHTITPQIIETDWNLAESATRTNIKLWSENPSIFGDIEPYFNLTGQTLTFAGGELAQALIVQYEPSYETESEGESESEVDATLQIDSMWEGSLVNGAVVRLGKLGVPAELVRLHAAKWEEAVALLRAGLSSRPEINVSQKLN